MISSHPWLFVGLLVGVISGFHAIATLSAIVAIGWQIRGRRRRRA